MSKESFSKVLDRLKVHDKENGRHTDRWTNADILPVLPENRTFTLKTYLGFWVSVGIAATYWNTGSTAIAAGLSPGLAIGAIVIGCIISTFITWGCSDFGIKYFIGFPMMSRAAFGMYGSFFVVVIKCFTNIVYSGIQAYWGGIAFGVVLSSIFPSFHRMKNTFPESANITTKDLIGTMLYYIIFFGLLCVKPYKLKPFFITSFWAVLLTIVGMFIWAMAANGGAGDLVSPTKSLSPGDTAFAFFQTVCVVCAPYTGVSIRHADWTRYTKTPRSAKLGIVIGNPLAASIAAIFGVFVTSATRSMYGQLIWQPMTLLAHIQDVDYSATTRAGTFFAGLGWLMSQFAINIASNAVATGMDLSSVVPMWLSARRGSLLLLFIGLVICPWNLVNAPSTFITVLSAFGTFMSPFIGIYIADYWIVRRKCYRVPDLYIGNSTSVYWYQYGFSVRAFGSWFLIVWMALPGLAVSINQSTSGLAWKRIFQISFLIGLVGGFTFYNIVCYFYPPPAAREYEPYDYAAEENTNRATKEVQDKDVHGEEVSDPDGLEKDTAKIETREA